MRNTLTPLHSDVWVAQWLAVLNILLYYLHDTIFGLFRLTQVRLTVALQYYKIIVFDATMYRTACICASFEYYLGGNSEGAMIIATL